MEQITMVLGIVALVSWTLGFGFVCACVGIVAMAIIEQTAEGLQTVSASTSSPLNLLPSQGKVAAGQA